MSNYIKRLSLYLQKKIQGHTTVPWYLLGINVAGGVCIALWAAVWSFFIFYPLNYFNLLRVKPQTEYRGVDITEHGEAAYPVDAWVELQVLISPTFYEQLFCTKGPCEAFFY